MTSRSLTRAERNQLALDTGHALDGLGKRALNGGIITFGAQILRIALSIVQSAVLARLLDPADFGLIAMAATVTSFVALFTDLGLSAATVQRSRVSQSLVSTLLALNILVGIGLMVVTMMIAPIAGMVFQDHRVTLITICLAACIPISAAGAQHTALLARAMRWIPIQLGSLVSQAAGFAVAVILILYADIGYWALVAQALCGSIFGTVFYWIVCDWRPNLAYNFRSAASEIKLGMGLTGFSLVNYFHRQLDNGLIGWFWGARELGFYSRGYNLFATFQTFSSQPINTVLMPLLSRSRDRPDYWRRNMLDAAAIVSLGNGLVGTLFTCLSGALVHILLGPAWTHSAEVLFYLAPTILISGNAVLGAVFTARGDMRALLQSATLNSASYVIGFAIALPHGIVAMGAAYSIVTLITLPLTIHLALRRDVVSATDYYRAIVPFILCGVAVIFLYMEIVPDPLGPASIGMLIVRGMALSVGYLALALLVFRINPDFAELRQRVWGHVSGLWTTHISGRLSSSPRHLP